MDTVTKFSDKYQSQDDIIEFFAGPHFDAGSHKDSRFVEVRIFFEGGPRSGDASVARMDAGGAFFDRVCRAILGRKSSVALDHMRPRACFVIDAGRSDWLARRDVGAQHVHIRSLWVVSAGYVDRFSRIVNKLAGSVGCRKRGIRQVEVFPIADNAIADVAQSILEDLYHTRTTC
ncbi:hypothetical protein, partial [Chelatococcus asaccharovorans]